MLPPCFHKIAQSFYSILKVSGNVDGLQLFRNLFFSHTFFFLFLCMCATQKKHQPILTPKASLN